MNRAFAIAAAIAMIAASPAFAHTEGAAAAGPGAGFLHPLGGLDHVLAMVAVGLLGAMLGGRARWLVPAAFVAMMIAGAGLAFSQPAVPLVEQGVIGSVLILGAVIAFGRRVALSTAVMLVGVLAVFHGQAHGTEIPAGAGGFAYAAGFALATIGLHALGLGLGTAFQAGREMVAPMAVRASGAAIALAGAVMVLS